ncbi:MAG: hypothetical protein WCT11_02995 [Candidatus Magasanikbacteria bacterium]
MLPSFHLTDLFFWVGFLFLLLFAGYHLIISWLRRVDSFSKIQGDVSVERTIRHFLRPAILTLLAITALICVTIGQGSQASTQNASLNPEMKVRDDFVKAQQEEAKTVTPKTVPAMEAERKQVEETKRKQAEEDARRRQEQSGEALKNFRQRVMERGINPTDITTP